MESTWWAERSLLFPGVCCWCFRNPANALSWYVGTFIPHPIEKRFGFLPRWLRISEPSIVGDVPKRNMSFPMTRSLSWLCISFELSLQLLHRIINKSRNHWRFPARNFIPAMQTIPAFLYYLLSYHRKRNLFLGRKPRIVCWYPPFFVEHLQLQDLHCIKKHLPFPSPAVFGHEISGTVVEHGEDVNGSRLPVGGKVACTFIMPCGSCFHCKRGSCLCFSFLISGLLLEGVKEDLLRERRMTEIHRGLQRVQEQTFPAGDLSPLVEQDSHFAMKVCQYGEVTYPRNYCIWMSTYITIPRSASLNKCFLLPIFWSSKFQV